MPRAPPAAEPIPRLEYILNNQKQRTKGQLLSATCHQHHKIDDSRVIGGAFSNMSHPHVVLAIHTSAGDAEVLGSAGVGIEGREIPGVTNAAGVANQLWAIPRWHARKRPTANLCPPLMLAKPPNWQIKCPPSSTRSASNGRLISSEAHRGERTATGWTRDSSTRCV